MESVESSFTRRDLFTLLPPELDAAATQLELPHLTAFWISVDRLQTARSDSTVRGYLWELIGHGWFTIVSPYTGRALKSGGSLLLADKTVIFSFPDEPALLLGVGDISLGFPICAALLTDRHLFLGLMATDWGFSERHIAAMASAIDASGWRPAPARRPPNLVFGDQNFAHHTWNELSALKELVGDALPPDLHLIATQQPLGPVQEIFPQLRPAGLTYLPDAQLPSLNAPGVLFTPVGGRIITAELVGHLLHFFRDRMSVECQAIDADLSATAGPVLWMSVRTRNRTLTNQHAVLLALGSRFLHVAPQGAVVIDGFSLPADFASSQTYHQAEARELVAEDQAAAEALREALEAQIPGARTYLAVGLTIADSITLSRHASIYFCHHGTVQHKIGWFNAVPGMVHCNRKILRSLPAAWVAAKSEVALPPFYVPAEFVCDAALPVRSYAQFDHLLQHENYTIADLPATLDAFFAYAADHGVAFGRDYCEGITIV